MCKSFLSDTRGNISVITAIVILLVILAAGGATDITKAHSHKSKLQSISDSSALAAAKGNTLKEMRALANASIDAHKNELLGSWKISKIDIKPKKTGGKKAVKVILTGEYQTSFLGIIGKDTLKIETYSEVNEERGDIEISLVLDISYSMKGNKLRGLKKAAKDFIDIVIGKKTTSDNISVNIVPFGGNVNLGTPLATRFMADAGANWDPSDREYKNTATSPDDKATALYRFTNGMNCIETRQSDYDTGKIDSDSRSQLPRFVNKNNLLTICPEDDSSVTYNTANKQVLKDKVDELVLSHGTGMDVGALWGLKTLSPSHKGIIGGDFPNRPGDFNGSNQKILVIMTDGNITGQGRPRKPNDPKLLTSQSAGTQTLYPAGTQNSLSSSDDASGRFKKVCDTAAANNVTVFTIGFKIKRGGSADQLLSYCATDSSKYFFVETSNPTAAFKSIATSVSQLRIVE